MSGINIGGVPLLARRIGTTDITKVMVGEAQIWPPVQNVKLISSTTSVAATGTFGTHQAGDLLVVVAVGAGATAPTAPSGFTTAYTSPSSEFSMGVRIGYRFATAANTSNGTWSGASYLSVYVFRGADSTTPFGAIASLNTASNTTGRAPAITPVNTNAQSVVIAAFVNNGTSGSYTVGAHPLGWISKNRAARFANNYKLDTTSINQTSETLNGGGSVNWRGLTFEVRPPSAAEAPNYLYDCTTVASTGYVVDFTVLDGWPAGDVNEAYMFRCSTVTGFDGYVGRSFQKTFRATAYSAFECTLEDLSGIAGKERKTISFTIYPRP